MSALRKVRIGYVVTGQSKCNGRWVITRAWGLTRNSAFRRYNYRVALRRLGYR